MSDNSADSTSGAIGPGNHAKAWNDPPMFSVQVNTAGKPVPTKLNRRVAFPIHSSGTSGATNSFGSGSMSLPPMSAPGTQMNCPQQGKTGASGIPSTSVFNPNDQFGNGP